jgi:hypothetical protein
MRWLAEQFGIERLLKARVILPTEEFFPEPFEESADDARRIMHRVCGYFDIDPNRIQLEICPDDQMLDAVGQYENSQQPVIRIVESQLADPQSLVATLAHELAHELLLGGGRLSPDAPDHEWVTDLLPAYFGVGIFAANSTVHESQRTSGQMYSWRIRKQGYLPSHMIGYAMALFAFMRHETRPAWAGHLRLDAKSALQGGLNYLEATDDSLFHPDTIRKPQTRLPAAELARRLREGTPSMRLATLWEISPDKNSDKSVVTAVTECLIDKDGSISATAGGTLAALGAAAAPALPELIAALSDPRENTRAGAARALGMICQSPETVIPELATLVQETNEAVITDAALALEQFGRQAESALPQVLMALQGAMIDCRYALIAALARTLTAITSNPADRIREFYCEGDQEMCDRALMALDELKVESDAK